MAVYKVCVVGGWCGNRMVIVAEHLSDLLESHGYPCRVFHHSVWDNPTQPPPCDLVLQLLQAFSPEELGTPIINIRPLLVELDDIPTITKILGHMHEHFPKSFPVIVNPVEVSAGARG